MTTRSTYVWNGSAWDEIGQWAPALLQVELMPTFTTKTETYELYEVALLSIQNVTAKLYGDMGVASGTTGQLWPRGNW